MSTMLYAPVLEAPSIQTIRAGGRGTPPPPPPDGGGSGSSGGESGTGGDTGDNSSDEGMDP